MFVIIYMIKESFNINDVNFYIKKLEWKVNIKFSMRKEIIKFRVVISEIKSIEIIKKN